MDKVLWNSSYSYSSDLGSSFTCNQVFASGRQLVFSFPGVVAEQHLFMHSTNPIRGHSKALLAKGTRRILFVLEAKETTYFILVV